MKVRLMALGLLALGVVAGYFIFPFAGIPNAINVPFRLGLDLKGGIGLIYRADTADVPPGQRSEVLEGLREVIERRINFFGVAEPIVRIERVGDEDRLVVRLAGVFDTKKAKELIGETPFLEFRTEKKVDINVVEGDTATSTEPVAPEFEPTELTGRYLDRAMLQFDNNGSPYVQLMFDDDGAKIFERITRENLDRPVAIYLDGAPISIPVVRGVISGGTAQITGNFKPEEARLLAQRLNSGALDVPIELIAQETVEPKQGAEALKKSFSAGLIGLLAVAVFMLFWYRFPGFIAVLSLMVYSALTLTLFKLIPVTFSTAGIAGFILSIGMAVDANILIFERMKEELRDGQALGNAIEEGFNRAWTSIRDSNASSIITAIILWYFGTDAVRGFALTLGIGVAVSMFSAIFVTRTFLRALRSHKQNAAGFMYATGFRGRP